MSYGDNGPSVAPIGMGDIKQMLAVMKVNVEKRYEEDKKQAIAKALTILNRPRFFGLIKPKKLYTEDNITAAEAENTRDQWDIDWTEYRYQRRQEFIGQIQAFVNSKADIVYLSAYDLQTLQSWQTP